MNDPDCSMAHVLYKRLQEPEGFTVTIELCTGTVYKEAAIQRLFNGTLEIDYQEPCREPGRRILIELRYVASLEIHEG